MKLKDIILLPFRVIILFFWLLGIFIWIRITSSREEWDEFMERL